jgi:hypothetical protein
VDARCAGRGGPPRRPDPAIDRLRGLPLVDLAQRMSNAAADYAAAFDAAKALRVE